MSWKRQYRSIQSEVKTQTDITQTALEAILSDLAASGLANSLGLFYLDHEVVWAKITAGKIHSLETDEIKVVTIQKARIFNDDRELLIIRQANGNYRTRLRIDGSGKPATVLEDRQVLLGASIEQANGGFSYLDESAGSSGWVPVEIKADGRAALITRSYIEYAGDLLAGYADHRIVAIEEVK